MRTIIGALITLTVALAVQPAVAAPGTVKFSDCASVRTIYPNGITYSRSSAADYASRGYRTPTVSRTIFRSNSGLDRNGDGVMCGRHKDGRPDRSDQKSAGSSNVDRAERAYIDDILADLREGNPTKAEWIEICRNFASSSYAADVSDYYSVSASIGVQDFGIAYDRARILAWAAVVVYCQDTGYRPLRV